MIKIRRVEDKPPATCISYSCDGDCTTSRALTVKAREEAAEKNEPGADQIEVVCPQIGSHMEQWRPDPDKKEFSVSAVIAAAAIESGYFEGVPEAQAKVKTIAGPATPPAPNAE